MSQIFITKQRSLLLINIILPLGPYNLNIELVLCYFFCIMRRRHIQRYIYITGHRN